MERTRFFGLMIVASLAIVTAAGCKKKECAAGDADACRVACEKKKDPEACRNLGLMYFNGQGAPKNMEEAKRLLLMGCEAGDGDACNVYGVALGVEGESGFSYQAKGCELGSWMGCLNAGNESRRRKEPPFVARAKHFSKGCELGSQECCEWVKKIEAFPSQDSWPPDS